MSVSSGYRMQTCVMAQPLELELRSGLKIMVVLRGQGRSPEGELVRLYEQLAFGGVVKVGERVVFTGLLDVALNMATQIAGGWIEA